MSTGIISPALPLSQLRHSERSCVGFPMSPPSCLLAKGLKEERENMIRAEKAFLITVWCWHLKFLWVWQVFKAESIL